MIRTLALVEFTLLSWYSGIVIKEIAFISTLIFGINSLPNVFCYNNILSNRGSSNITETNITSDYDDTLYYNLDPGLGSSINFSTDYRPSYGIPFPSTGIDDPFANDSFVPNKEFLIKYFKNLKNNKITNYLGVCGYTALGMFLSFYDTYWNDDFIEEKYESDKTLITSTNFNNKDFKYESPGIIDNTLNNTNYSLDEFKRQIENEGYTDPDSTIYKEKLDDKIMSVVYSEINNQTFAGKLFQLSIDNGFIQPHYANDGNKTVISSNYVSGLGIGYETTNTNLQSYINSIPSLNGHVSIVTSRLANNSDEEKRRLRSEIVEIVKSGRPVIMGGNTTAGGHVVVAYKYDEDSDALIGNMGWKSQYSCEQNLDSYYTVQISDYWALKFDSSFEKTKTNHYVFTDYQAYYAPGYEYIFHEIKPWYNNFYEGYARYETTSSINFDGISSSVTSKRKRCALIQQNYVVLSTRRYEDGLGIAYLEYTFPTDVKSITVDLSWWSDKEFVTANNSSYTIDYLNENNEYETIYDLWDDATLSTDKSNPTYVYVSMPNNVRTFRFYGYAENPEYYRNKGRLVIQNMTVTH